VRMAVDGLIRRLDAINRIGYKENDGITRLALSEEDERARNMVIHMCKDLGLKIRKDAVGNIWARKEGTDPNLPSVMMGSHIDTVPNGGRYDGTLGVMAAIEVMDWINKKKILHRHPIELIVFVAEESSRFNIATVGSKALAGSLSISTLKNCRDADGISLYDALLQRGYEPEKLETAILPPEKAKAFVELHIEQGSVLEKEKIDIGIVEAIAAPIRLQIQLIGQEAHSGSCPMEDRRDALNAAAEIILSVEKNGRAESKHKTVATTGNCKVFPGAMNVIPGEVYLYIDIRGIDLQSMLRVLNAVIAQTKEICEKRDIQYAIEVLSRERPVSLDRDLMEQVKQNCRKLGLTYKEMPSGAGHDTMNIAKIIPAALIFIPCVGGISHNKREEVRLKDLKNGLSILFETIISLAK
jgi:N-carbamoyl-L-amino-acid hydrolase